MRPSRLSRIARKFALGLSDPFVVSGGQLLPLVAIGAAVAMAVGLALTVLLAFVYNVTCSVFGGLALDVDSRRRSRPARS